MYHPIFPLSPSLFGLFVRSVPLGSGIPHSRYSVIIPLYNKEKTIKKAIEQILNQTKKASQIIVIDDCSTDNSYEEASHYKDVITLLKNKKNVGKAETINLALKEVKYSFVLIVDADTFLEHNFAQQVLKGFYNRKVKGVCGTVLPNKTQSIYEYNRLIQYLYGQKLYKVIQTRSHGIWVLSGCATMWRTAFLLKNKYPSNTVVEDMEMSWVAQKDFLINYNPKAICYTQEPQSFKEYIKQIKRWFSWKEVAQRHLKTVRLGLKATFLWYIGEAIGFLVYSIFLLWNLISGNYLGFGLMLLIDFIIMVSISLWEGRKFKVPLRKVLIGIPCFYALRLFDTIMFWKGLIKPERKWK